MDILAHHGWLGFHIVAIIVAAVATVIDWRTGLIPNWLTFPTILIPPLVHLSAYGLQDGTTRGFLPSLAGILICGAPSILLFNTVHKTSSGGVDNAMGGGDVKLFAGFGALLGPILAIVCVAYIVILAALMGVAIAVRRGGLKKLLTNVFVILTNPFRPASRKVEVYADHMLMVRLGPAILPGALLAIAHQDWPAFAVFYGW